MKAEFEKRLASYRQMVTEKMLGLLNQKDPQTLYEPMRYAVTAGGKQIRPCLMLLTCEAVGGNPQDALDAAVALEIVHNFTLVHDDIMDHDELRRGKETVYKHWDENVAILAGDALLVIAYASLAKIATNDLSRVIQDFSYSILKVCEGQTLDKEFETRGSVSLQEYFDMIDKKTACLFSIACEVGARLGGGTPEHINAMQNYGLKLGRAFQIQDDLLDIIADENILGKDIGSDLEENKKTFMVVHAMETADKPTRKILSDILTKDGITTDDIKTVIDLFQQNGTIVKAKDEINISLKEAEEMVNQLPENESSHYLKYLLTTIQNRNS